MLCHDDKKYGKGVNSLLSEMIMTKVFGDYALISKGSSMQTKYLCILIHI